MAWRRSLTKLVRSLRGACLGIQRHGSRRTAEWMLVRRYLFDTRATWEPASMRELVTLAAFGLRAFIAGLMISIGLGLAAGSPASAAGLAALVELLWASARLTILLLVLPVDVPRANALLAFAAGLIPYAVGVTPVLALAALGLSALLTARGLLATGASAGAVRTSVCWAFGGQAVIVIAGVIVRGVIAALGGA